MNHEIVIFTRKKSSTGINQNCSKAYYINVPHEWAEQHTQRDVFEGVQSSSGALKRFA